MMKRNLSVIILLGLILLLIPVFAEASTYASGSCATNIRWSLSNDGVLTVSSDNESMGIMTSFNPDNGQNAPWKQHADRITSVVITGTVKNISPYAFDSCSHITKITFQGSGMQEIGDYAFKNCSALTAIEFPSTTAIVGKYVFDGCTQLSSITFSPSSSVYLGDYVFANCTGLTSISLPLIYLDAIPTHAFDGCANLSRITIPEGVETISSYAFANCSNLTSIILPGSISTIEYGAFKDCSSLATVYYSGNNWNNISIAENNKKLTGAERMSCGNYSCGDNATWSLYNNGLLHIRGTGAITATGSWNNSAVKEILIESGITGINYSVFSGKCNLKKVSLPASLTQIANYAFQNCRSISDVYYSGTLAQWKALSIGEGNNFLTKANIHYLDHPEHTPGEAVHENEIPATYTADGSYDEVVYCTVCEAELSRTPKTIDRLVKVLISDTIADGSITWSLDSTGLLTLSGTGAIPDYSSSSANGLAPWYYYRENNINVFINRILIENGITEIGNNAFYACPAKEVSIPGSVQRIGNGAFWACINLEELSIPNEDASIEPNAFYECSALETLNLPAKLSVLPYRAVYRCESLEIINLPATLTTIGDEVFSGCQSLTDFRLAEANTAYAVYNGALYTKDLKTLICYPAQKSSLSLSDNLEQIKPYAFDYCVNLTTISLPESVTTIGNYAFMYCNALETVTVPGNVTRININCFLQSTNVQVVTFMSSSTSVIGNYSSNGYSPNMHFFAHEDSSAQKYATEKSIPFTAIHFLTPVDAKPATCSTNGNTAYWICSDCDAVFSDEAGTMETTADAVIIPVHHSLTKTNAVPATCTTAGNSAYWTCGSCGRFFSDAEGTDEINENSWIIPAGHTLTKTDAVGATCSSEGSIDYWTCSVCKEIFSDEDGTTEITADATVTKKLPHTEGSPVREGIIDATCTAEGSYDEVVYCSVCHEKISTTPKTIEKKAHTPAAAVVENRIEASCQVTGSYDEVVYCSVCGEKISSETKTIAKLAHTPAAAVEENRIEASCRATGSYDEVVYCSVCREKISSETKTIAKLAHTPAAAVEENRIEASCQATGSYDEVVYCSVCGEKISSETKTIAKPAHTPAAPVHENEIAATCKTAGSYDEVVYCSVCHEKLSTTPKTIEKSTTHTPGAVTHENEIAATCTDSGSYDAVVRCAFCDTELSRERKTVNTLGHDWGEATYIWSEDNKRVTAERHCKRNPEHLEKETVGTKATVTAEATYDAPGSITYTTKQFPNPAFTSQTKTEVIQQLVRPPEETTPDSLSSQYSDKTGNYEIDPNGKATFIGPKKNASRFTIPDTIKVNGKKVKVTKIAPRAFKNMSKLKSVTIGKYVTEIGEEAFSGCKKLTSVTFGSAVKTIRAKAFYQCKKLKNLYFKGKKLKSVETDSFKGIKSKPDIQCPKGKTKSYKKLLKEGGIKKGNYSEK